MLQYKNVENVTSLVTRSGQTNPNHAALDQEIGLDQETSASLAQVAIARADSGYCINPAQ